MHLPSPPYTESEQFTLWPLSLHFPPRTHPLALFVERSPSGTCYSIPHRPTPTPPSDTSHSIPHPTLWYLSVMASFSMRRVLTCRCVSLIRDCRGVGGWEGGGEEGRIDLPLCLARTSMQPSRPAPHLHVSPPWTVRGQPPDWPPTCISRQTPSKSVTASCSTASSSCRSLESCMGKAGVSWREAGRKVGEGCPQRWRQVAIVLQKVGCGRTGQLEGGAAGQAVHPRGSGRGPPRVKSPPSGIIIAPLRLLLSPQPPPHPHHRESPLSLPPLSTLSLSSLSCVWRTIRSCRARRASPPWHSSMIWLMRWSAALMSACLA